jgi:hypothetical protein
MNIAKWTYDIGSYQYLCDMKVMHYRTLHQSKFHFQFTS